MQQKEHDADQSWNERLLKELMGLDETDFIFEGVNKETMGFATKSTAIGVVGVK